MIQDGFNVTQGQVIDVIEVSFVAPEFYATVLDIYPSDRSVMDTMLERKTAKAEALSLFVTSQIFFNLSSER